VAKQPDEARRARATEEAATWLERLERTLQHDESAALRAWLKTSLHREIILERCKFWHGPDILAVLLTLIPDIPPPRPRLRERRIVLAISLAVCGLGLSTFLIAGSTLWPNSNSQRSSLRAEEAYRTPVGARREVDLPDGSTMTLNTSTHVLISYGLRSRDVTLLRGEASFGVIQDPDRPFRVSAGARRFEVEDQASRFNLRRVTMDRTELTVTEGQVRALDSRVRAPLTPAQLRVGPSYGERTVSASEYGILEPGWHFTWRLTATELRQRLAWQQGLIVVANDTLEDVLKEFERYTTTRFVFQDETLRNARLNTELPAGDVDILLRVLRDMLQIQSVPNDAGQIVLSRVSEE
jgi:transmembrane sensor